MNSFHLKQLFRENLACDLQISKAVKFMLCDIPIKASPASGREKQPGHVNQIYQHGGASHPLSTCVKVTDRPPP